MNKQMPQKTATVVVDKLGVKIAGTPRSLGEKPPESWREVWQQFNRHLMRIVTGGTRFLAEAFEGGTRIVRGVSMISEEKELSSSTQAKIMDAHTQGDLLEERQQEQSQSSQLVLDAEAAVNRLQSILEKLRGKGAVVEVVRLSDGQVAIMVVRPDHRTAAVHATMRERVRLGKLTSDQMDGQVEVSSRFEAGEPPSSTESQEVTSPVRLLKLISRDLDKEE